MKKLILLLFLLCFEGYSQTGVTYFEMTVDVKANFKNEFIIVESIKTKKKLWIKNVKMEESKEYDILVEVFHGQNGSRIYGKVIFFDYSARQKTLNFREAKKDIKQKIITNF